MGVVPSRQADCPDAAAGGGRRCLTKWSQASGWAKLHHLVLDELGSHGELDWTRCAIDSVNLRALKGGT